MDRKRRLLILICISILTLCGCKETAVLKQIVYREGQQVVDHSQQQVDDSEDEAEEDGTLSARKEAEESDRKQDTENSISLNEEEAEDSGRSAAVNYDENGNAGAASSGSDASEEQSGGGEKKESRKSTAKNKKNADAGDAFDDTASVDDETDEGSGDAPGTDPTPSGGESTHKVTDQNGKEIEVPEKVDQVTAVGEAAIMVEMLGGEDRLAGTSASVTENALAAEVFPDLEDTSTWWSGTGEDPLSAAAFQELLKSGVSVCFVESGADTFSSDQLTSLAKEGIVCVTLYPLNTPEHIKADVSLIAEVLGDRSADEGMKDAVTMAQKYNQWLDGVLSDFSGSHFTDYTLTKYLAGDSAGWNSTGSGKYTLLVQHWDDTADVRICANESMGLIEVWSGGAGAADSGYFDSPVSYFMSIACVVNTAAAESAIEQRLDSYTWYVNQWVNASCIVTIDGRYTSYRASGNYSGPLLAQLSLDPIQLTNKVNLGSARFDTLIAASQTIAANLEKNKLTKSYPYVSAGNYFGFEYSSTLRMMSSIQGDYEIVTNPYGASCWYEGSLEAPLEAYWISAQFGTGTISMESVREKIEGFYKDFYGYTLSEAQTDAILDASYVPACREK